MAQMRQRDKTENTKQIGRAGRSGREADEGDEGLHIVRGDKCADLGDAMDRGDIKINN